jgi:aconitate hydratase
MQEVIRLVHDFAQSKTCLLTVDGQDFLYYPLAQIQELGYDTDRLPFSIRILLEAALRQRDELTVTADHVRVLADWSNPDWCGTEIPFKPARILLQDFTGVPAITDLAAMRSWLHRRGGRAGKVNPLIPVDLVIDHSVMVDEAGHAGAFSANITNEFKRNIERYRFLRWAQHAFAQLRIVPPGTGIVHQVNLEYLATLVQTDETADGTLLYPDTLVGADSHTTMINGLGIVGWGVGGIEAEACMLGQPLYLNLPEVIGVHLSGSLPETSNATDLALVITQLLRREGVVGKIVEFFGPGIENMSLPDRATIANMAPEYGSTMGYFPVDRESLNYLRQTGRDPGLVRRVEAYYAAQNLLYRPDGPQPHYSHEISLDLGSVYPSLAGPKRPQDLIDLRDMKMQYKADLVRPVDEGGFGLTAAETGKTIALQLDSETVTLKNGSVVLAAITSCTNTSNPVVMFGAGLMARKAVARGLRKPCFVKASLTPGSQVVTEYLEQAGLMADLEQLGFHVVGYGCCTCIGNSGQLAAPVARAVDDNNLIVASVLSGNRNYEGRIHPQIRANYLASPMLVVAYALAGTVDIDWQTEPLGQAADGSPVFLCDIWPTASELAEVIDAFLSPELFRKKYSDVFSGPVKWKQLEAPEGERYTWNDASTYIKEPPFFDNLDLEARSTEVFKPFCQARILVLLGDTVTTDHISPAGIIAATSPAGRYLQEKGVMPADFNAYGARRGNHDVMLRGTFANNRLRNHLVPGVEGGYTRKLPESTVMPIYDAAMAYGDEHTDLIVIAGKEYGTGSSRDWAAKGTFLLGVSAVLAESFERIHRSNLVGMGVLPLQFMSGVNWQNLGIKGDEHFTLEAPAMPLVPLAQVQITMTRPDGTQIRLPVQMRLENQMDIIYYQNGGILQTVLKDMM